jgi:hypothetical protein
MATVRDSWRSVGPGIKGGILLGSQAAFSVSVYSRSAAPKLSNTMQNYNNLTPGTEWAVNERCTFGFPSSILHHLSCHRHFMEAYTAKSRACCPSRQCLSSLPQQSADMLSAVPHSQCLVHSFNQGGGGTLTSPKKERERESVGKPTGRNPRCLCCAAGNASISPF